MALSKIQSASIADGSVSASDLASTLNLTGKTVTLASGVGGKVLQMQYRIDSIPETQIARDDYYNFPTISITPISTTSKIVLFGNPCFYTRSQDQVASYGYTDLMAQDITNNAQWVIQSWVNYLDSTASITNGLRLMYPAMYIVTNSVTTLRQFRFRAYCHSSVNYGRVGATENMTTMAIEIAN